MKNKVELKKYLSLSFLIIIFFNVFFLIFHYVQYKIYTINYNEKINMIISEVMENYPNIEENKIIEILNNNENSNGELLKKYGIDLKKDSVILENNTYFSYFFVLNLIILCGYSLVLVALFLRYDRRKDKKLAQITNYIEEINKKNYSLDIEDNTEDELSILKNEIYKTTIMLKEVAENSLNDKVNLKNSLSDISHQLKTPLTSILIMLDNILDNKDMDEKTRNDFIKDIKKEINNIRFLVESLLKLSKLDSNSIKFIKSNVLIKDMLEEAVDKVDVLCDLKNIHINIEGNNTAEIFCDKKWQVEALVNILKNCVEHSSSNSKIDISYNQNKIYSEIVIKDYGEGIDKKEIKHVFERFYKCKNSSSESVGIGLSLAKSIIESNGGYIEVQSELGKGTTFYIKYID